MSSNSRAYWEESCPAPSIVDSELHIWRHDLDGDEGSDTSLLDETEIRKASSFATTRIRDRYVAAHKFLRRALACYGGKDPANLSFSIGPFGKPSLNEIKLGFNLSHSGGVGYLAVAGVDLLGIDVELSRAVENPLELATLVFSPSEVSEVRSSLEANVASTFLRGWTRKEALVKALGIGIAVDLRAIDVGTTIADRIVTGIAEAPGTRMMVRTLQCMVGEHVAVAMPEIPTNIRYFQLALPSQ